MNPTRSRFRERPPANNFWAPWWMFGRPVRLRAAPPPPTRQEEQEETVTVLVRSVVYVLAAVATVSVSRAADDASYPARPIHIVVGFAAGGAPLEALLLRRFVAVDPAAYDVLVIRAQAADNAGIAR